MRHPWRLLAVVTALLGATASGAAAQTPATTPLTGQEQIACTQNGVASTCTSGEVATLAFAIGKMPPVTGFPVQIFQVQQPTDYGTATALGKSGAAAFTWSSSLQPNLGGQYSLLYFPAYALFFPEPGWTDTLLNWLYANHPDWIMYQSDGQTVAWEYNNYNNPPINITAQAVMQHFNSQVAANAAGYQALGVDNLNAAPIVASLPMNAPTATPDTLGPGTCGSYCLVNGQEYYFKIVPYNITSCQRVRPASGCAQVNGPEGMAQAPSGGSANEIQLDWSSTPAPPAVSYRVYFGTAKNAENAYFTTTSPAFTFNTTQGTSGTITANPATPEAGYYAGPAAGPCVATQRPACGGTWTQPASTSGATVDPAWTTASLAQTQSLVVLGHSLGMRVFGNLAQDGGLAGGYGPGRIPMADALDGSFQEAVPENGGATNTLDVSYNGFATDDRFQLQLYNSENTPTNGLHGYFSYLQYFPGTVIPEDSVNMTAAEQQTNLAYFLLTEQGPYTYMFVGAKGSNALPDYPQLLGGPITLSTTATTTNASTSLTGVGSTVEMAPGMAVYALGIPSGTYIAAVTSNTITLSQAATLSGTGVPITVNSPTVQITANVCRGASSCATVTANALTGLSGELGVAPGQTVSGTGIPPETYITNVASTAIYMSNPAFMPGTGVTITIGGQTPIPIGQPIQAPPAGDPQQAPTPPPGSVLCGWIGGVDNGICSREYSRGIVYYNSVCQFSNTVGQCQYGNSTFPGTISGTTLTTGTATSGHIAVNQEITGTGVALGTYIVANAGSSSTWTVNISQNISTSETMTGAAAVIPPPITPDAPWAPNTTWWEIGCTSVPMTTGPTPTPMPILLPPSTGLVLVAGDNYCPFPH